MEHRAGILPALEYPGRLILVGAGPDRDTARIVYAITGRSASSQARKLVYCEHGIWVEPTDQETLKKGNVDLLVYPAVLFDAAGAAVSNGRQTAEIRSRLGLERTGGPVSVLAEALEKWDFEPDAPIFTPRISGCVCGGRAGLSLIRRGTKGESLRSYFDFPLEPGSGRLVSTYQGPNRDPLPCFEGEPLVTGFPALTARETAEAIYEDLAPAAGAKDFRVAVASVTVPVEAPGAGDVYIINRHERI